MPVYKNEDLDKLVDLAYDTGWLAAKLELVGVKEFSDEELKSTCEHQQEQIKKRELLRRRIGLNLTQRKELIKENDQLIYERECGLREGESTPLTLGDA